MAAIGREGGHSRGARARAGSPSGSDVASNAGSQPFVRQANDDRGYESNNRFGSQDRSGSDRSASSRGDNANEGGPLSNRDRI